MTAAVGAVAAGGARAAGAGAARTAAGSSTARSTAGDLVTDVARKKLSRPKGPKARGKTRVRGSQRLLMAEFIVCVLLLGLHPLARPEGEVSAKAWMKRGTAVCFLFVMLGMAGSVGPKSQRAATMFGGLVAIVLLIDQRSAFGVLVKKLNAPPAPPPEGPAGASSGGLTAGGTAGG